MRRVVFEGVVNPGTFFCEYSALEQYVTQELHGEKLDRIWLPGAGGTLEMYHLPSFNVSLYHLKEPAPISDEPRIKGDPTKAKVVACGDPKAVQSVDALLIAAAESYTPEKR